MSGPRKERSCCGTVDRHLRARRFLFTSIVARNISQLQQHAASLFKLERLSSSPPESYGTLTFTRLCDLSSTNGVSHATSYILKQVCLETLPHSSPATMVGVDNFGPVLAALSVMQSNVERSQKNTAHTYLENFQKSVSSRTARRPAGTRLIPFQERCMDSYGSNAFQS